MTEQWADVPRFAHQKPQRVHLRAAEPEIPDPVRTDASNQPIGQSISEIGLDVNAQAESGEDAFLLAVLHPGFWAMPPGGFTRFLIQPPIPIDPDLTFAMR